MKSILAALVRAAGRAVLALPLAVAAPSLSVATVPGCGCSGGGAGLNGLGVTVIDEASGALVCDATVTAREGDHSETLRPVRPDGGDCFYVGASERPGTYTIEVVLGNRMAGLAGVQVGQGECHVRPTSVDIELP